MKIDKPFLVRCKIYMDRARMYIGYAQFFILLWVLLNSMQSKYLKVFSSHPILSITVVMVLFLTGSLVVGWIDMKLGLYQEEQNRHSKLNPFNKEIMDKLEEIKEGITKNNNGV